MRLLKVKQPGLFLNLTGAYPTRTPAEIDITKCDINLVLSELRAYGIDNFEIINKADKSIPEYGNDSVRSKKDPSIENHKKGSKVRPVGNSKSLNNTEKQDDQFSLDRIENLIKELVELSKEKQKETVYMEKSDNSNSQDNQNEEPDVEDFIPEPDFSGLKYNKGKK